MITDELIAKLVAAKQPDRHLDAEIANAIELFHWRYGSREEGYTNHTVYRPTYDDAETTTRNTRGGGLKYSDKLPRFTEDVSAAMTLRPANTDDTLYGLFMLSGPHGAGEARVWCRVRDEGAEGGWAIGVVPGNPGLPANIGPNLAIALCIACLKARKG